MQESEKSQGARCISTYKTVWIFPLTQQIVVLGRPARAANLGQNLIPGKRRGCAWRSTPWLWPAVYRLFLPQDSITTYTVCNQLKL